MRNTGYFKGKKVTVVGFARSGLACANLLHEIGAEISVTDICDNVKTRRNAAQLRSKDIRLELGRHSKEFIEGRDLVVISPGVEETSQAVIWARTLKIPVISEIEAGSILCPGTIVATTGSNGKTTVTTLISRIIQAAGRNAFLLGNIGNPFCAEVDKIREGDFVALEISSFQLETIISFKPKIAVVLNFSRNHLDRYHDLDEYFQAKKRIFLNQDGSDYLVLNAEDPLLVSMAEEAKSKVLNFSKKEGLNANQAAVLAVGSILNIDENLCRSVLTGFKGLEHRCEEAAEINNIKFINDSKATTPESCLWALNNLSGPVILIAGGKDKGVDYRVIMDAAAKKVKKAVLIGEARHKIRKAFNGDLSCEEAATMEEAVNLAYNGAAPGDCILLSPMCSSFDMFINYEERGRVFKEVVQKLRKHLV